jgi:uncharacterized phage protein (TIGR02216 family)
VNSPQAPGAGAVFALLCLRLRIAPDAVWRLSFAEIRLIAGAAQAATAPLARDDLESLMRRHPDPQTRKAGT